VKRKRSRAAPSKRAKGSLDWVKKRPLPVVNILIADSDKKARNAAA